MIELELPFPVSVNALFRNRRRGRAITAKYKAWLYDAGWAIKQQRPRAIEGPVTIEYAFANGRKADIDNLPKAVSDLLVKHQLISDDGPAIVRGISCRFESDVAGVRVRVRAA